MLHYHYEEIMFKKGLVSNFTETFFGYTPRAFTLFFLLFSSFILFFSTSLFYLLADYTTILLLHAGVSPFAHSWLATLLTLPVQWLVYYIGIGVYFLCFLFLFITYVLFKRYTFEEEWDRLLSCILLIVIAPVLMQCYLAHDIAAMVTCGKLGIKICTFVFTIFDPLLGILFLQIMTLILTVIITRFYFVSYLSYVIRIMTRQADRGGSSTPVEQDSFSFDSSTTSEETVVEFTASEPSQFSSTAEHANQLDNDVRLEVEQDILVQPEPSLQEDEAPLSHSFEPVRMEEESLEPPVVEMVPKESGVEEPDSFDEEVNEPYVMPSRTIFTPPSTSHNSSDDLDTDALILEDKLNRFGVKGKVVSIKPGPVVTLFEYEPEADSKISKIMSLEDDLALALQALSIRIIAPIPGRSVVGFEVANKKRKSVALATLIHSNAFISCTAELPIALGHDTVGKEVIIDLSTLPHLLVAGSTGSGKSVMLNALLVGLLCKKSPEDLKLILIDPKRLEFSAYADIAHLLFPIITETHKVGAVLRWVTQEMERRYELMAAIGVKNIFDYKKSEHARVHEFLPYIVIVVDELADLMMLAGKEVEDLIARITQMARAAGIHLVVATQRPSVDVITGIIKVNFPSRISFRVTSKVDSRTILDTIGAEKLLGRGDMLFLNSASSVLERVHGSYVSDSEIKQLVNYIKNQRKVNYEEITHEIERGAILDVQDDQLYRNVKEYVQSVDEISISLVQRKFRVGYNRSARIIEKLESDGLIMPAQGGRTRKVVR